jgi:hypothetical protein
VIEPGSIETPIWERSESTAEAIAHALGASRPRTRYVVGADAKGQAFLRWLLPDRLLDRAFARVIGL